MNNQRATNGIGWCVQYYETHKTMSWQPVCENELVVTFITHKEAEEGMKLLDAKYCGSVDLRVYELLSKEK